MNEIVKYQSNCPTSYNFSFLIEPFGANLILTLVDYFVAYGFYLGFTKDGQLRKLGYKGTLFEFTKVKLLFPFGNSWYKICNIKYQASLSNYYLIIKVFYLEGKSMFQKVFLLFSDSLW